MFAVAAPDPSPIELGPKSLCKLFTAMSLPVLEVSTTLDAEPSLATTSVTPAPDKPALISNTASSAVEFVALPLIVLANVTFTVVPL